LSIPDGAAAERFCLPTLHPRRILETLPAEEVPMKSLCRYAVAAAIVLSLSALVSAQRASRTVFIKAVDASGAPVAGLTAADFEVREGDAKRTITYAGPASGPMRLILLIDNSEKAAPFQGQMRDALMAFVDAIPEPHEIGIITIGRQVRVRQAPIADRARLRDTVNKMSLDGGGILFFDALRDAESRFMKKDGVRWPAYVMFVTDGTESSTPIQGEEVQ
jgi:hypothetical protein